MSSSFSTILVRGFSAGVLTLSAVACDSSTLLDGQGDSTADAALAQVSAPAPSPIAAVPVGSTSVHLWPYVSSNLQAPEDPVSLIFVGEADPRALRAALLALDGDRTAFGFPPVFPFNCTWDDAIGGVQGGYTDDAGWSGSAIQLQCGAYQPIRFHLRFFAAGGVTLGGAHFEVLIPGTADHQVLSWELAEQLVTADFVRSGLLGAAPSQTAAINGSPWRAIPPVIYNGLPAELQQLAGGPIGSTAIPVPIQNDGHATILTLAERAAPVPNRPPQDFVIQYDQVVPKPFCAGGAFQYVYVDGPVRLRQWAEETASGNFVSHFHAEGTLAVTPVDPSTSPPTPIGDTYLAQVNEMHRGRVTDQGSFAQSTIIQMELPPIGEFRGRLVAVLGVESGGEGTFGLTIECAP
ncbi:MAG TPA: hypothetical protein VFO06_05155 [Gemmatimonadales bacterium]|nr:hypothetical protein [Gemmatimonadales bacterium]